MRFGIVTKLTDNKKTTKFTSRWSMVLAFDDAHEYVLTVREMGILSPEHAYQNIRWQRLPMKGLVKILELESMIPEPLSAFLA
jgi:hypothetical protein